MALDIPGAARRQHLNEVRWWSLHQGELQIVYSDGSVRVFLLPVGSSIVVTERPLEEI